jgi:hypothetical protein
MEDKMSDGNDGDGCFTFVIFILLLVFGYMFAEKVLEMDAKLDTLVDHTCVSEEGPVMPEWVKELRK